MVALQDLTAPAQARTRGPLREFLGDFAAFIGRRGIHAGIFLLLGALLEGIGLLMLLPLLSVVIGAETGAGWLDGFTRWIVSMAPGATPFWQLAFLLLIFALLMAARSFVILTRDVALARLQIGFVESHRLRIIELLAHTRWDVVSRLRHGRITHVLGGDVQACGDAAQLTLQLGVAATMLAGQCILLFLLSPRLALLILGLLAAGMLALRPVLKRSREIGAGLTESNLHLVTSTSQFLGGLKLAISQNLQRGFVREFEETVAIVRARRIAFVRQRTGAQLALTALAAAVAALTLLIGIGVLVAAPSTLIAFLFILARMTGPAGQLQSGAQHVFHSLPAYAKVKELEAELGAAQSARPDNDRGPAIAPGPVEFRNASFAHADRPAQGEAGGVTDISLTIEPGAFVGVTGPSGAGKTTFADLLVGLYPPRSGSVLIGGSPLEGRTLGGWRNSISYVSQDPFLFHDTIRRNLLWANPEADEAALWQALALAGADTLVRRMAGGLEAVVGERGSLVSGGERQRIALARALVRRPALLLLDEATNAIDVAGEREILERLSRVPDRPTIVMIAHRQASLDLCERLIELDQGRIVRNG
ncbi:MAG TPA: ABC transporter ATP-binding protein [Allosphingosinicella sp.]|jgi:ATP-binding cassette subfamily C protein